MTTDTPTPPTRTRKATKVMVLAKEPTGSMKFVMERIKDGKVNGTKDGPNPMEVADQTVALKWIKENGARQVAYLPVRTVGDWRTVTVETTEVRSLK